LHAFLEVWKIASSSRYKAKQNKSTSRSTKANSSPYPKKTQKKLLFFCASSGKFWTIGCKKRERTNWPKKKHAQLCTPWIVAAESFARERRERNDEEARRSSSTSQKGGPQIRDPNKFGTSLGGLKSQLSSRRRLVT
jgi:hypothetical protein